MKDIYELLPNIILYLASGYIFLTVFKFTAWEENDNLDFEGKLSLALVCGFILKSFLSLIPCRFTEYVNIVGLLCFSIIVGILFGKFIRCKKFETFLGKFFHRTSDTNLWHDLIDIKEFMWIKAYDSKVNRNIIGIAVSIEEGQRFPVIELQQYYICDETGTILEDFRQDATMHILINSEKYEITIAYDEKSTKVKKYEIQG